MASTALGRSWKLVGIDDGGPGTITLTAFPAGCACTEVLLRESGVCVCECTRNVGLKGHLFVHCKASLFSPCPDVNF